MNYNSKSKKCFDKLIMVSELDDIVSIIENANVTFGTLRSGLSNYCVVYNKLEYKDSLKEKLKLYSKYLKDKNKKVNSKKHDYIVACNVIKNFITKDISISDYCKINNISNCTFKKYLKLISVIDEALYKEYVDYINKKEENDIKDFKYNIHMLCDLLENGIIENNKIRKMDIIDYYDYCDLSFNILMKKANEFKLSYEQKELLRKFVVANNGYDKTKNSDIKQILSEKVILGDGYVVEEAVKLSIMEKLKEKNIPINRKTYTLMFRRNIEEFKNTKKKII